MLSVTPVHEPFPTEGHHDRPGVIHNGSSDSTEVHKLGRQLRRFFSRLRPPNPTKRAYCSEEMGGLFRGNGPGHVSAIFRRKWTPERADTSCPVPSKRAYRRNPAELRNRPGS
jgi:hypothetical protein